MDGKQYKKHVLRCCVHVEVQKGKNKGDGLQIYMSIYFAVA